MSSHCIKREKIDNGYTEYYTTKYGECTEDDNCLWYIRERNIINAESEYCLAIVNSISISSKECDKPVKEALFSQEFIIEDDTICTSLNNCLKDRRGEVGNKKNKDEYYEWVISTSLPK